MKKKLAKKLVDVDFTELLEKDKERKELLYKTDTLKAERNKTSSLVPQLKKEGKDVSAIIEEMKKLVEAINNLQGALNSTDNIELTDRQIVILSVLRDNVSLAVPLNTTILSQKLKVARKTMQRELGELQKIGAVSRLGGRKFGYWIVNEDWK